MPRGTTKEDENEGSLHVAYPGSVVLLNSRESKKSTIIFVQSYNRRLITLAAVQ